MRVITLNGMIPMQCTQMIMVKLSGMRYLSKGKESDNIIVKRLRGLTWQILLP